MPGAPGSPGQKAGGARRAAPGGTPNSTTGCAAIGGAGTGLDAASVALSKGYIVAEPGARGRTLQDEDGQYTGKAPAAIVDLKAAVRYLRYIEA